VIHGETGWLLPPKAIEPLADSISSLIADPRLRENMGRTGQLRFTDLFKHQTMTQQVREIYAKVLRGAG
jgi:glycosyltransferase involved in cell wall biosynthesis